MTDKTNPHAELVAEARETLGRMEITGYGAMHGDLIRRCAAALSQPAGEPVGANDAPAIRQKPFPVIWWQSKTAKPGPLTISWRVAEYAYSVYSRTYGRTQSLERLAERGGFHAGELDEFLPDWREQDSAALPEDMVLVKRERLAGIEFAASGYCPACSGWDVEKGRGCTPKAHTKDCWLAATAKEE